MLTWRPSTWPASSCPLLRFVPPPPCLLLVLLSSCPVGVHGGRRRGAVELVRLRWQGLTLRRQGVMVDLAGVVVLSSTCRGRPGGCRRVVVDLPVAGVVVSSSTWRASTCHGRLGGRRHVVVDLVGVRRDRWRAVNVAHSRRGVWSTLPASIWRVVDVAWSTGRGRAKGPHPSTRGEGQDTPPCCRCCSPWCWR